MGAAKKYGSPIIVLLNTFFGVIGLVLLVAGFFVKYATDYVDKYGKELISKFQDKLPAAIGDKLENVKISEFVGGASTAFIIVGVAVLTLVVWAYCGICCQSKWMLIVYAALLTAIIIGEATVAILFATNRSMIDEKIKQPLLDSLDLYEGSTSNSAISLAWNALMGLLGCCGVDGPDDFKKAKVWNHKLDPNEFPNQVASAGIVTPVTIAAPVVCTKDKAAAIQTILNNGASSVKYIQIGCYEAIWTEIERHQGIAIGIFAGLGAFQIVLWILTVCLIREFGKSNRNKVAPIS
ncbi:tetraspanin-18-like [Mercenaria mercenaria]|uniref:tetraspanin-18-like n=1 Tax=Mercenaria mercenaria TaxID=6596 RepID=UPI00234F5A24|nr:tetraspanin-18-like [Mercenaria mercenaria]XP_045207748.2 tetraspanin-18-like [Mercenaria mercenaria]